MGYLFCRSNAALYAMCRLKSSTAELSDMSELSIRESLFTVEWMCRVKREVVVSVCGFAIQVSGYFAIAQSNCSVPEIDLISVDLFSELFCSVDTIYVCEETFQLF